jgi:hypothetical protein
MFALFRRLQRQIFIWLYSLSRGIKRDLAVKYFPHERPNTARRKMKFEIAIRPRLRQRLRKLHPDDRSKFYSESELSAIKKYPKMPPFVPLIIILIGTWLTFFSGLSSESTERQLQVFAFQTNPMAGDRLPECVKRIGSRQTADQRFPNESFETPSPYFKLKSNTLSQKTEEKRKFIKNEIIAPLKKKLLGFCFLASFPTGRRCVTDAVPAVSLWSMWMVWTIY